MKSNDAKSLKQTAYNYIYDMIVKGEIQPGDTIVEQTIAEKINISRTPIREALKMLAQENLVALVPNRGAYLQIPSFKETWEVFQIREALEPLAASLCIDRFSNELILRYRGYINDAKENLTPELVQRQDGFHQDIIQLCGNEHLVTFLNIIHKSIRRLQLVSERQPGRIHRSILEHEQILDAIAERNRVLAGERMREHIVSVRDSILNVIGNT